MRQYMQAPPYGPPTSTSALWAAGLPAGIVRTFEVELEALHSISALRLFVGRDVPAGCRATIMPTGMSALHICSDLRYKMRRRDSTAQIRRNLLSPAEYKPIVEMLENRVGTIFALVLVRRRLQ